jgi:glycosyltransferase involved in cell wall biosynthesis
MSAKDELANRVAASTIKKVRVLAWRDLDDVEAGGSELHMDQFLRRWAAAGLHIDSRTSAVAGQPSRIQRHGYFSERKGGRYLVFPEAMWRGFRRDSHDYDALVEIWNGVPFLGPLWFRGPRLTLLHHVHRDMWRMSLPPTLAKLGWWIERSMAPVFYRRGIVSTLSASSAQEIEELLGLRRVVVTPVGVSDFFSPGAERSNVPLVVAVGRLVPVKRFDLLIDQFRMVREKVPNAQFVIVGEGYLRSDLEAQIHDLGAHEWISLPGRISDDALLDMYRRAWVVTSHSLREGWGMSITEAAACGTTSVVVDITGHRDAVQNGVSGVLVAEGKNLSYAIVSVLTNEEQRAKLNEGALQYAATFSWDAVALRLFELLDERARALKA